MNRTPLLLAALVPFVAVASQGSDRQQVDQQKLKSHVQATKVLGAEVQSSDGVDVGTVEDIIFDKQGNISSVLVQREGNLMGEGRDRWPGAGEAEDEGDMERAAERSDETLERETEQAGAAIERGAEQTGDAIEAGAEETERMAERGAAETEQEWEEATGDRERDGYADAESRERDADLVAADAGDREQREGSGMDVTMDPDRAETTEMGDDFAKLQWSDVSYNAEEQVLRLSGQASSALKPVEYDQTSAQTLQGEVRASKLVGLEVNLSDEESWGEVEDVMIDAQGGKASAIVVDSMEFFSKERYALPVDLSNINTEEEVLNLQLSEKQVKDMGEFEMEETLSIR